MHGRLLHELLPAPPGGRGPVRYLSARGLPRPEFPPPPGSLSPDRGTTNGLPSEAFFATIIDAQMQTPPNHGILGLP
jgi:hypothetical protein